MHSLPRAVARAAWRPARLGAGLDISPVFKATRKSPGYQSNPLPSTCLQCRARTFLPSWRYYSSQPPSNRTDTQANEKQTKSDSTEQAIDAQTSPTSSDTSPDATAQATTELPSASESRRSTLNQKFSDAMDNLQSRILTATQTLNDITGYSGIEVIKKENAVLETALSKAHDQVRAARLDYKTSNSKRANTQREVTTLLARKDTWSPADLERFTELYRTDHVLEGAVASAQESLTEAELEEQSLSQRLNAGILKRYHEEQIWSDRIRRASTWGTWGLMGMNFLLFVVLQFVAEPWKRRRLVRGVVAEEKEVLNEVRSELEAVKVALTRREEPVVESEISPTASDEASDPSLDPAPPMEVVSKPTETWGELLADPSKWTAAAHDLVSERQANLRMRDVSLVALEGVITGAAVVASIAWALSGRA